MMTPERRAFLARSAISIVVTTVLVVGHVSASSAATQSRPTDDPPAIRWTLPEEAKEAALRHVDRSGVRDDEKAPAREVLLAMAAGKDSSQAAPTLEGLKPAEIDSLARGQASKLLSGVTEPTRDFADRSNPSRVYVTLTDFATEYATNGDLAALVSSSTDSAHLAQTIRDSLRPRLEAALRSSSEDLTVTAAEQIEAAISLVVAIKADDTARIAVSAARFALVAVKGAGRLLVALVGAAFFPVELLATVALRLVAIIGQITANAAHDRATFESLVRARDSSWATYTNELARDVRGYAQQNLQASWSIVRAQIRYEYAFVQGLLEAGADGRPGDLAEAQQEASRVYQDVLSGRADGVVRDVDAALTDRLRQAENDTYATFFPAFRSAVENEVVESYRQYRCSRGPVWLRQICQRNGPDRTDRDNANARFSELMNSPKPTGSYRRPAVQPLSSDLGFPGVNPPGGGQGARP